MADRMAKGDSESEARAYYDAYSDLMKAKYRMLGRAKKEADQAAAEAAAKGPDPEINAAAMALMSLKYPTTEGEFEGMKGTFPTPAKLTESISAAKSSDDICKKVSNEELASVALIASSVDVLFPSGGGGSSKGGRRKHMRGGSLTSAIMGVYRASCSAVMGGLSTLSGDIENRLNAIAARLATPETAPKVAAAIKAALKVVGTGLVMNDLRSGTNGVIGSVVVAICKAIEVVTPDALSPIQSFLGASQIVSAAGLTALNVVPVAATAFIVGKIVNDLYQRGQAEVVAFDPRREANAYYDAAQLFLTRQAGEGGNALWSMIQANLAEDEADVGQQLVVARTVLDYPRGSPQRERAFQALRDAAPLPDGGGEGGSGSASSGPMDTGGRRRSRKHRRHRRHHRKTLKRV